VADKRCENGHFIDEAWDICPYCPAERPSEPDAAPVRPSRGAVADQPRVNTAVTPAVPRREGARETPPTPPPPMERTVAVQKIEGASGKRYVVAWLVGLTGPARGESYPVRMGRNILGRDRKSDIVINDDQASSHHADLVFRPEERRFILMDHNSTNGTYVNEVEIEPRRDLTGRDVIRIGAQKYLFVPLCQDDFIWDSEGALK
jgi:hypothetical protein